MRLSRFPVAVLAAALAAGLLATAVFAAVRSADQPAKPDASYSGRAAAVGDRPETEPAGHRLRVADVRESLGVLRRSPAASDALPKAMSDGPLLSDGVAATGSARRVETARGPVWVAPSRSGEAVCVVAAGELACPPADEIAAEAASVGIFKHYGTPWRVIGIARDDVVDASVRLADGTVSDVAIADNVFVAETELPPAEIRWRASDGWHARQGPADRGQTAAP